MAKSSDPRLALEPELRASVVNLTQTHDSLTEASELQRDEDVAETPEPMPSGKKARQRVKASPKKSKSGGPKKKRKRPSVHRVLDRSAYLPVHYDLADCVPLDDEGPGRPRLHPVFLTFMYLTAASDGRSYANTDVALDDDFLWRRQRALVLRAWSRHPDFDIGTVPINYSHACRFFDAHVVGKPEVRRALYDAYVRFSVDLARRMNIATESGSYLHPDKGRIFIGDATVVAPLFTAWPGDTWFDPETGETGLARHDPNAQLYRTGDGKIARGTLWANCHIRSDDENERVNLGFAQVPKGRGDASVFMDLVEAVRSELPLTQGHVYDMAMDGETINRGYKLGLVPISKVALAKNGRPSSAQIERATVINNHGLPEEVQLWAFNGALGIETLTPTATLFVRLDLQRIKFATNADGTKRPYGRYVFPDIAEIKPSLRGKRVDIRLDQTDGDRARRIKGRAANRAIYLRPFPEGHATFDDVFGLREDAESFNNLLKQSLWNKRSRSLHPDRQFLDMLGFNLNRNIRAAMAYEERTGTNLFPEMEAGRPSLAEVTNSLSQALAL